MKIRARRVEPQARVFVRAFTLLEVMIALTIFFLAIVSILGSVSRSLGAARSLQQKFPDISALVADLMLTNRVEEGTGEGDFGDSFPGYAWTGYTNQIATNGLFQIDFVIRSVNGRQSVEWTNSIYLWRPDSKVATFGGR
jgi:Tfp pilus assembly protein PilV